MLELCICVVFFFFQAEDGIRDIGVTGVQTCALPIFFGVDLVAVYVAFRLNYRAARAYEDVEVSREALVIRKVAPSGRVQELRFNPAWIRLELDKDPEEGVTRITVRSRDQRVPVGAFLNPDDKGSFARAFGAALAEARR